MAKKILSTRGPLTFTPVNKHPRMLSTRVVGRVFCWNFGDGMRLYLYMLVQCFQMKRNAVKTYDKKSYDNKLRFSMFDLWTLDLSNFDLKIEFRFKNCTYN